MENQRGIPQLFRLKYLERKGIFQFIFYPLFIEWLSDFVPLWEKSSIGKLYKDMCGDFKFILDGDKSVIGFKDGFKAKSSQRGLVFEWRMGLFKKPTNDPCLECNGSGLCPGFDFDCRQ